MPALLPKQKPAVTVRSILIGAFLCATINVGEPFIVGYVHGSPLAADFSTGAAIFLIFVLSLMINLPLRAFAPRLALNRSELLVCYIMMLISCAIPSWGFSMLLIPWIVAPTYYVTPENQWEQYILPNLPKDYFVLDELAAKQFFEGLKEGESLPWELWVGPLLRWGAFILCFYIASVCIMMLLRRQWIAHERLAFPLAQMPLAVIPGSEGRRKSTYLHVAFWIGMAVPALVYSLQALNVYWADVPTIPRGTYLPVRELFGLSGFNMGMHLTIYLEVIGLSFLLGTDMAFSLWLFAFLAFLEQGVFNSLGFRIGPGELYSQPGGQEVSYQALGAMLVLVIVGFWRARGHLRGTLLRALRLGEAEGEEEEIVPYTFAYLGLLLSGGYVIWWWHQIGISWSAWVLGFWIIILFVGLSRAVAQGGMAYARSPVVAGAATLHTVGSASLGTPGIVGIAMTSPYAMDTRTMVMASTANGLRLAEEIPGTRRRLAFAILVTLLVSLVAAFLTILIMPYKVGGSSLTGWGFSSGYHQWIFNWAKTQMIREVPLGYPQFGFMGIGAFLMFLLTWAQKTCYWWPLHPLGLVLGYTHPVCHTWFSVFLAWLSKVLILKIGGGAMYQNARPFFIGLAVGGFVTAGFWSIIHAIVGHGATVFTLG